jgi:N-acetylneuraminate synthase/pseudaminic acid synthase
MIKNFFEKIIYPKNNEVKIIAEMSGNHQGTFKGANKFVRQAIKMGADAIKFQVYRADTITLNSNKKDFLVKSEGVWGKFKTLHDLYEEAHTPWEWISKLANSLNSKKFPWFASPFDISSVDFLEELNCQAYKIASPEITDIPLIEKIALTKKPIILSTGLASLKDIDLAVKTIKKKHKKFSILKCVSSYPNPLKDLNLISIKLIKDRYKCSVGFSDHTVGDLAAKVAVTQGATIIEKHFKNDNDDFSIDSHFSMELSNLRQFKTDLNNINIILGNSNMELPLSAQKNISGRRSLYVSKNILKGEKFSTENVKSVRPSFGLHPKYLKKIIGKKAKKNLKFADRVSLKSVDGL